MSAVHLLAAVAVGAGLAGAVAIVRPPPGRLAGRVRPYTVAARSALELPVDTPGHDPERRPGVLAPVFDPIVRDLAARVSRLVGSGRDAALRRHLDQAGRGDVTIEQHRVHQLSTGALHAAVFAAAGVVSPLAPAGVVLMTVAGFVHGASRVRRALDRSIERRAARMRLELVTVDQLLAVHLRTGAGALQAVRGLVARGRGAVVDELQRVLDQVRAGASEVEALHAAAETTPEPAAARTYRTLAIGVERGADLAEALLGLADDLREARREELRRDATRRRAAMLVPTIGILAPIMLLFLAAPLPSIVLGT